MLIYFIVMAIVVVLASWAGRPIKKEQRILLYALCVLVMTLLAGFRNVSVGTDSGNYVHMFDLTRSVDDLQFAKLEKGYFVLCLLAHTVSDNYWSIFFVVALSVSICFIWTISRWSLIPWVSVFALFVSGNYAMSWNGTRQGLAIAIVFAAFSALLARRLWLFGGLVALASFFHITAIIAFPMSFMVIRRGQAWLRLMIVTAAGVIIANFDWLVEMGMEVDERLARYGGANTGEGRGLLVTAFLCILCLFFFAFRRFVSKQAPIYDVLLNLFFIGVVIALVSAIRGTGGSGMRRLAFYFTTSEILLWPIVFSNLRQQKTKTNLLIGFLFMYSIYFGATLQAFSNMVPFAFNPIIQQWFR